MSDRVQAPRCCGCGVAVAVASARTRVTAAGRVELWCGSCPALAAVAAAPAPPPPAPLELARTLAGVIAGPPAAAAGPRRAPWTAPAALLVVALGGVFYAERIDGAHGDSSAPAAASPPGAGDAVPVVSRSPAAGGAAPLGVLVDGEPIEDRFPTLAGWVHPVLATDEPLPANASRRFGAGRPGRRPAECGGGHCGVDLAGPRGTPVLAVAPGVVAQVHRAADGRGGRYVRIRHPDDSVSSYFHLDEVAPLAVGQEVDAGQALGTLGRSGIEVSGPHLHFGVAIADGDHLRHIDPLPFLARATTLTRPAAP